MISRFPLLALLAAAPAWAAEPDSNLAGSLGQMVFGLAVVIGLLLASLWFIKRLSAPRGAAAGLKVLGAVPVGQRERVVMLEVGDKVLLLGVTQTNVRTLHTMAADELRIEPAPPAGSAMPRDFSGWLRQSLERRGDGR